LTAVAAPGWPGELGALWLAAELGTGAVFRQAADERMRLSAIGAAKIIFISDPSYRLLVGCS